MVRALFLEAPKRTIVGLSLKYFILKHGNYVFIVILLMETVFDLEDLILTFGSATY